MTPFSISPASVRALFCAVATLVWVQASAWAVGITNKAVYTPALITLQGTVPFAQSYTLEITSPANYPAGQTSTVSFVRQVDAVPAGVSEATALSYLSFSTNQLTFTGRLQKQSVVVTLTVPADGIAGAYGFQLNTVGWPTGITFDNFGASVNATVTFVPQPNPPTVIITTPDDGAVYTVPHTSLPVVVPFAFTATTNPTDPVVSSVAATLNGTVITLNPPVGLNTALASATASLSIAQPGKYSLNASGTNSVGTANDTSEFTVAVTAPPPTVVINTPTPNSTYTYRTGDPATNVPFTFTATSHFGGIRTLTAKVDGADVTFTPSGLGTLSATGTINLPYTTQGAHTLEVTTTDDYGTDTDTSNFTVNVITPTPTIDITTPTQNQEFQIPAGATSVDVPFQFNTTSNNGFVVDAVSAMLGTTPAPIATTTGLGTASAQSAGILPSLTAGTYTLTATGVSAGITVSDTVTFRVVGSATVPPSVVIDTPPVGSTYTLAPGGTLSIPLTFTGTSNTPGGVITTLTASLGSTALNVTPTDLNTKIAKGAATMTVTAAGTHTISVTAIDAYGTASATRTFVVTVAEPRTVSGKTFFDLDQDGTFDVSEFGLGGVTLKLLDASSQVVATKTSGADGSYAFTQIAPGSYSVVATAFAGLKATTPATRSVTVGTSNVTVPAIGFALDFKAICGMKAGGFSHGFWKSNIDKAISCKTSGSQVSAEKIKRYTAQIGDLALAPYDSLTLKQASAILNSKSSKASDLLSKQLLAAEYNYAHGGYINQNAGLTLLFIWWGEHLLENGGSTSELLFAKDWFDAYNNSHGDSFCGPSIPGTSPAPLPPTPSIGISNPAAGQTFTIPAGHTKMDVPYTFVTTSNNGYGVDSVSAKLGSTSITPSTVGLGTATATSSGTLSNLPAGSYTLTANGLSGGVAVAASTTFTIVRKPTVEINQPSICSIYTRPADGPAVSIPFLFTGTSYSNGITAVSAKLDGVALAVTPNKLGQLVATGAGTMQVLTQGEHTLTVTATDDQGTATTSRSFNVLVVKPTLAVTITKPSSQQVITRLAGSPATNVPFSFTAKTTQGVVSAVSATLDGETLSVAPSGLYTATATGSGTLKVSKAGTYILKAYSKTAGGLTATESVAFIVKETQAAPQPCAASVAWVSPGKSATVADNRTMEITFKVKQCCTSSSHGSCTNDDDDDDDDDHKGWGSRWNDDDDKGGSSRGFFKHSSSSAKYSSTSSWFSGRDDDDDDDKSGGSSSGSQCAYIADPTVIVSVYEIYSNGKASAPKIYTFKSGAADSAHYTIDGQKVYKLDFKTSSGRHEYQIDVDYFAAGSTKPVLIGSREFTAK